jgi:hypothetical protein
MPRPERYKDVLERVLEVTTHPSGPTTEQTREGETERHACAELMRDSSGSDPSYLNEVLK